MTRFSLIQKIQEGDRDQQCWEDFVDSYSSYISSIIYFFKLNPSLHDDLLQEVLLQVYKDLPKYEYRPGQCKFRTWLSLVTRNVIKTYLKSKANKTSKKNVSFDEVIQAVEKTTESEIEIQSEKEWQVFMVEKALKNLRKNTSEKVMTVLDGYVNETPDSEISEKLDISESSVRVYRKRGLTALKKEIHRLSAELDIQD